ncbi:hypothetical protein QL093DRAFT_2364135 [Fusarium oxysporum]|nr:hypothetical protein QL093DRAFT_2364135 [Fusarium oxysporum]
MTILNSTPPSQDDQTPAHPIPIIIIIVVFLILYILLIYDIKFRTPSNNTLASSESESDQSSRSTNPEVSNLQQLDSIAPPRVYKQVTTEMEIEGPGEHSAWPDALVICAICLETMADSDIVRRLPCGHTFHSGCITPWYLGQHYTCPLCVSHFMPSGCAHVRTGT